jgi:uncharacterized SAM-binding protein YcdF (DUF218 family)
MKQKTRKNWMRRARFLLIAIVLAATVWFIYAWQLIDRTIQEARPRHADVGIVLGAAIWGERPSPSLRERLDQALQLYRDGYVRYLLVTGGLGEGKTVTEAEVMQAYLLEQGVPEEAILLEDKATSTYENLLYSQEVMETYDLQTALLISHDFHLARAIDIAEDLELQASPIGTKSRVLSESYYKVREVLALAHWQVARLFS